MHIIFENKDFIWRKFLNYQFLPWSMEIKGKKVIVTGGAGFIGSHIVEALHQDNDVHVVDNLSTGYKENIAPFKHTFHQVDINETDKLIEIFQGASYVFHLGALGSVPRSVQDPLASDAANATGTLSVFWAAKEAGIKRVVFSSSSSVYGQSDKAFKHEDDPKNPISPYAVTKTTGELYASVFNHNYGMEITSLRYQNIFGPRQNPNGAYAAVIPKFCVAILAGEQAKIYGDGSQTRDFTFVENAVQANVKAAVSKNFGIYNISTSKPMNVNQLYEIIADELNWDKPALHVEERKGDIKHAYGDITRAREQIGYDPEQDIEGQVRLTARWYAENL